MNGINKESFQEILQNEEVFEMFKKNTIENSVGFVKDHKEEMQMMLDETFRLLYENRHDSEKLKKCVEYIVTNIFKKQDDQFWFNQMHDDYKINIKPRQRYKIIRNVIVGRSVLDLGCGDGLLSSLLSENGFDVYMADVLDYRKQEASHLPFKKMEDPSKIPYGDKEMDNILLFAVLHHIDDKDIKEYLKELKRVGKRIIIKEDTYDIPSDLIGFDEVVANDEQLRKFMALSKQNQLRYLIFLDYFSNIMVRGTLEMNFPFSFRTVNEWREMFKESGFIVKESRLLGFLNYKFSRTCYVLHVIDALD